MPSEGAAVDKLKGILHMLVVVVDVVAVVAVATLLVLLISKLRIAVANLYIATWLLLLLPLHL